MARRQHVLEVPLSTSLLLLCAASTPSSRVGGFPALDEGLDARGAHDAAACRLPPGFDNHVLCSPSRAAAQTAQAMGLDASVEVALVDMDAGRWSGRSFADLFAAEPAALSDWIADPTQGTADGETMEAVRQRVGGWLDGIAQSPGCICAISHAMTIRAALAHALGFPLVTTPAIDIAPLSTVRLSFNRIWRLQAIAPHSGLADGPGSRYRRPHPGSRKPPSMTDRAGSPQGD
ncbi:histidine phosphatase family protein [Sphingobium cupriresistens]|uniref:histidine phosphatase family protein n=1 Tax=Sphingobium cupriresistens TaxID=1132417 RepID=UPI000AB34F79|nr:histidine phosphatase family protein [Sphingobium cupriresistens]